MFIYLFLLVIILSLGYIIEQSKLKNKQGLFFIVLYPLFVSIQGFRSYQVGTDTWMFYRDIFFNFQNETYSYIFHNSGSLVYDLLQKTIFDFTGSYQVQIFFVALCTNFFVFLFFYDNQSSMYQSIVSLYAYVCLYFYLNSFNISREMMAMSVALYSWYFLKRNKILRAIIVIFVAIGIHPTAIITLVFIVVYLLKSNNKKNTIKLMMILNILVLSYQMLLTMFVSYFPKYNMYLNSNRDLNTNDKNSGNFVFLGVFYLLIFIIALVLFFKKNTNYFEKIISYKEIIIYSLVVNFNLIFANLKFMNRMGIFFSIFSCLFLPKTIELLIKSMKMKRDFAFTLKLLLILILLIPLIFMLNKNLSDVVPYKFFWNQ